jgi:hypothetical protein
MKPIRFSILSFLIYFSSLTLVSAQAEFCSGLEQIIAASYTRFDDFQADYSLELVGAGNSAETKIYYSKWHKDFSFPTKEAGLAKYNEIAARLASCKIDGVDLEQTEDDVTRRKQIDRIKVGRWTLPANHPYGEVFIEMELTQMVNAVALTFDVNNGDLKRLYTSKAPPMPRHPLPAAASAATLAPPVQPITLCSALDKVLQAPADFASIKGKQKRTAGTMGIFESNVSLPGAKESSIYASAVAPPTFIASFLTTTDESSAQRKYEEIKQQLSACNLEAGEFSASENDLDEGKISTWKPSNLSDDKAARYGNLIIELTNDKNFLDNYEVDLKISYTNN